MVKFLKHALYGLALSAVVTIGVLVMGAVVYKHFIKPSLPTEQVKTQLEGIATKAEGIKDKMTAQIAMLKSYASKVKHSDEVIRHRDKRIALLEKYIVDNGLPLPVDSTPTLAPIPIEVQ